MTLAPTSRPLRRALTLLAALATAIVSFGFAPGDVVTAAATSHTRSQGSVTGPGGVEITFTLYRPAGASAEAPVPAIIQGHGWAGSRTDSDGAFQRELDRGFAVLSFDQRGFGASGGKANVQDPELEGKDVAALIDHLAGLDWIAKNTDGDGAAIADDPVVFGIGGSYGGGFQFIGALTELRDDGRTRFDALAPEITWFDLAESLAPQDVARTVWNVALYAVGAADIVEYVHTAFAYGTTTGQWPDGTVPGIHDLDTEFTRHSPVAFVQQGIQLDIPVLVGQGTTDSLFNLNEGIHNFLETLSDKARHQSLFVAYNGGHVLPTLFPSSTGVSADACSGPGGFGELRLRFFEHVIAGENPAQLLPARYNLTTDDGSRCVRTDSIEEVRSFATGHDLQVTTGTATNTGAGVAQYLPLTSGPLTVAGIPTLTAEVTSIGVEQRVFLALAVGTSPGDATIVQGNMMPLHEMLPVVQQQRTVELPGVSVDVPEGSTLYLVVAPTWDLMVGHASVRTPGAVILENPTVTLPVPVEDAYPGEGHGLGRR